MKHKRSLKFLLTFVMGVSLVGCVQKKEPEKVYKKALNDLESLESYEKTTHFDFDVKVRNGYKNELMNEILNKGNFKVISKRDKNEEKTEMKLMVNSDIDYVKFNTSVLFLVDEKNKKVYLDAGNLFDTARKFTDIKVPILNKGDLVEIDLKEEKDENNKSTNPFTGNPILSILEVDLNELVKNASDSSVERIELNAEEKREKIKDKIKINLSEKEMNKVEAEHFKNLDFEKIEVILYINKEGELIREDTNLSTKVNNEESLEHLVINSSSDYEEINEEIKYDIKEDAGNKFKLNDLFKESVKK